MALICIRRVILYVKVSSVSSGGPDFILLSAIQALRAFLERLNVWEGNKVYQLLGSKRTLEYSAVPSSSLTTALRIAFCSGREILRLTRPVHTHLASFDP